MTAIIGIILSVLISAILLGGLVGVVVYVTVLYWLAAETCQRRGIEEQ